MKDKKSKFRLEDESCAICGGSVDHDGYGECESCHVFYYSDHVDCLSIHNGDLLCPDCKASAMQAAKGVA
jgi:hypothetical protein